MEKHKKIKIKRMFNPYKSSNFIFDVKREINGKKYHFGGEYPYDDRLKHKLKKILRRNGYEVHIDIKKSNGNMIIWTREKDRY